MKRWLSSILLIVFCVAMSLPLLVNEHEAHHCEEEHDGAVVHGNTEEHHVCLLFNGQLTTTFLIESQPISHSIAQDQIAFNSYFEPYSSVLLSFTKSRAPPVFG